VYSLIGVKQRNGKNTLQQLGQQIGSVFYFVRAEPQSEMLQLQAQHSIFRPFGQETNHCFNIQRASNICNYQFDATHYKNWLEQSLQSTVTI